MEPHEDPQKFLPLTPAVFHILLSLAAGERHGYAVLQDIAASSGGQLTTVPERCTEQ